MIAQKLVYQYMEYYAAIKKDQSVALNQGLLAMSGDIFGVTSWG